MMPPTPEGLVDLLSCVIISLFIMITIIITGRDRPMKTLPFGRSNMAATRIFRLPCLGLTQSMPQTVTTEWFSSAPS